MQSKYHFLAFDALANLSLRGHDTRVVLRRGFAGSLSETGMRMRDDKQPIFTGNHVESRSVVNELSFSIGAEFPTYFYTIVEMKYQKILILPLLLH